ncbi:hypothetical protein LAZ40_06060 [Cereibacter sphaeroides]|uniref:hypothetical protein n=1 Tax=Rhodobacterales TaxID=204455 RepID=UPI000BBF1E2B|nr:MULTISPECIES: hypothetical protein [Paracoccaceae]MCE6951135.1 hypothetical protein [Cereibacter sphaeroides]MCE6958613.1 hypothetical protein [Cereibacter sphaeroides]MCE6968954.1 hypothetical protein [Cereibacter sphaeroides]MCE6972344.1 hypothetical protein [Cereibacter sphaeroides]
MSIVLLQLARMRRLRALRYLHREGLETANVFMLPSAPDAGRERLPRSSYPLAIAMDAEHAKVVQMIR